MSDEIAYRIVKRALADGGFLQCLDKDPEAALEEQGITDRDEKHELMGVLLLLQHAMAQTAETSKLLLDQLKTTLQTADTFKVGLRSTVEQIDRAFRSTMLMYTVAFYLGVGLIVFSVLFAVFGDEAVLSGAFGGLGILDVVAYFITKPPRDLQSSRADLAQLQAAYFNWFIDGYNWNTFLNVEGRAGRINLETLKDISTTLHENTDKTMALIQKYCEFKG